MVSECAYFGEVSQFECPVPSAGDFAKAPCPVLWLVERLSLSKGLSASALDFWDWVMLWVLGGALF